MCHRRAANWWKCDKNPPRWKKWVSDFLLRLVRRFLRFFRSRFVIFQVSASEQCCLGISLLWHFCASQLARKCRTTDLTWMTFSAINWCPSRWCCSRQTRRMVCKTQRKRHSTKNLNVRQRIKLMEQTELLQMLSAQWVFTERWLIIFCALNSWPSRSSRRFDRKEWKIVWELPEHYRKWNLWPTVPYRSKAAPESLACFMMRDQENTKTGWQSKSYLYLSFTHFTISSFANLF